MTTSSFDEKCADLKKNFAPLSTEERYDLLISLGRALPEYPATLKTSLHIVSGCQSALYLYPTFTEGKLYFQAQSDALISAGLAALLIHVYSGETPETILTSPPTFLTDLQLTISPNRSNGLAHIHLRMKQLALEALTGKL
ncbi:MAG TPA: SufE family protein [Chlamydiales bacterium]|nr:SufE family protein [Chlamydiales bacterium]